MKLGEKAKEHAVALGVIATLIGAGYAAGKDNNAAAYESQKIALAAAQNEIKSLQAENSALKLSTATPDLPSGLNSVGIKLPPGSVPIKKLSGKEIAYLRQGNSAEFYNGLVTVSLIGIQFGGNPGRFQAAYRITHGNSYQKRFEHVDVGYTTQIGSSLIRLTGVDGVTAIFTALQ